jgi:hypothetical protein
MKFLISIYGTDELWTSIPDDERDALIAATDAHNTELFNSGEMLFACGTASPGAYRLVTTESGAPVVTEGPYIETKEYLGSFYVVDCDDLDRAIDIAAKMPSSAFRNIEVIPILHGGAEADF